MGMLLRWGKKIYYQHFPSGDMAAYIRTLYIKKHLKGLKFKRALDAGCGTGEFTYFFAQRHPEAQLVGYDISEEVIQQAENAAKERGLSNVKFRVRDLRRVDETEGYDFIFSLECLEHIPDNVPVLENLSRALAPGGALYIMMPCEKIHKYLFPRDWFEQYNEWAAKEHIGDQYTLGELVPIVEGLGIRVLQAQYTFGFWGKLAWELSMLTEERKRLQRFLLPLLFLIGLLDVAVPIGKGSPYGLLLLGQKTGGG